MSEFSITPPVGPRNVTDALQETMKERLRKLGESIPNKKEDKELLRACQEFESFFIYMVMKEMRKTVPKSGLINGGRAEEIFQDLMDEEMGKSIAKTPGGSGFGIATMLYRQLKRPEAIIPAKPKTDEEEPRNSL